MGFTWDLWDETNIFAPENGWLEDEFPFGMAQFQVRTVSFREGTLPQKTNMMMVIFQNVMLVFRGVHSLKLTQFAKFYIQKVQYLKFFIFLAPSSRFF